MCSQLSFCKRLVCVSKTFRVWWKCTNRGPGHWKWEIYFPANVFISELFSFSDLAQVQGIHIHEEFSLSSLKDDVAVLTTKEELFTDVNKEEYDKIDIYANDFNREYQK